MRLAYIVSHPIQYQAPLLRRLAGESWVRMKTFFLTNSGAQPFHDTGFNQTIEWDVPLLDGYDHEFVARELPLPLRFNEPNGCAWSRWFREGRFDAVWLHGYAHGALLRAFAAAKTAGLKVLVRGESHAALRATEPRWRQLMLRMLFQQVDAFLAIGSANRDFYLAHGVPAERIHLAPYSVDNDFFRSKLAGAHSRRNALARQLQLSPSKPIVLFASKLQARKRCLDLLEAYETIKSRTPAQILVVGDGPEYSHLTRWASDRGLTDIRFAGFRNQSEMPAFYDLCDVFVLPSEREPWGLVVNEAAVIAHPDLQGLRRFSLATRDAHGLYRRFGFDALAHPDRHMEIARPRVYVEGGIRT